jgi:hypothetical protein
LILFPRFTPYRAVPLRRNGPAESALNYAT